MTTTKKKGAEVPPPAPPPADFERALLKAKAARVQLDLKTDALNQQLQYAEQAIIELQLGVPGRVTIDKTPTGLERYLIFAKFNDKWRLMTDWGTGGVAGRDAPVPLINSSRALRLAAARNLSALVMKMVEHIDSELALVSEAYDHASKFVSTLFEAEMGSPPPADEGSPPPPGDDDAPF